MARRNRRRPGSTQADAPKGPDAVPDVRRAVIYARVSSTEQHVEGFSVDAQLELLREYAKTEKIEVVQEFVDVETAKKAGRTGFNAMLEKLAKEGLTTILCEKTDRLYRNITDWVTLDRLKLEIHLVKENLVLSEESRSHEKFIHGIKVLMAKNYIDNLSEETSKGMRQKAKQGGWPHTAPIGYLNVRGPDGKNIIQVDPERGSVVAQLFELYASGQTSIKDLMNFCDQVGMRTRKGNKVSRQTIHYLLQNPIYMGDFCWKGEWFKGRHRPIVTPSMWDEVQDVLDSRSRSSAHAKRRTFIFSGIISCGVCHDEGVHRILTGEEKKKQYVYYSCARCRDLERGKYHNQNAVLKHVLGSLEQLHMPADLMELVTEALRGSQIDAAITTDEARARLMGRAEELRRMLRTGYNDRLSGKLPIAIYAELAEDWRVELEQVEHQAAAYGKADLKLMDQGIALLELATNAVETFKSMNDRRRRDLMLSMGHNSRLWIDRFEIEWRKPFNLLAESPYALERHEAVFDDENGPNSKWLRDCVPTRNFCGHLASGSMAVS